MTRRWQAQSFRGRFILILAVVAVLPLAVVGAWLTRSIGRAGEALLLSEMNQSVAKIRSGIENRWAERRGDLLLMAQNEAALRIVGSPRHDTTDTAYLRRLFEAERGTVSNADYVDSRHRVAFALRDSDLAAAGDHSQISMRSGTAAITVRVPIRSDPDQHPTGQLVARVSLEGVLPGDTASQLPNQAVVQVVDAETHTSLLAARAPDSLLARDRFDFDGATWLAVRSSLSDPALELIVASPAAPYIQPFEHVATLGSIVLGTVAIAGLLLGALLTTRLTASLESLAVAADAVGAGDLDRRIDCTGSTEVGRVAAAFNNMTESLRATLAELSRRRALAAIGEFAASLSHEVRNALTSIRVDLQLAEEQLAPDAASRRQLARALSSVARLDGAVTGSLRVARGGSVTRKLVEVRAILTAAAESAAYTFAASRARLILPDARQDDVWIQGDPLALEQLFLNLMMNAAQAMPDGGDAVVAVERVDRDVIISITDDGPGISRSAIARATDPFYSTRAEGTGLGLAISRQIAIAHGGTLELSSLGGRGTRVEVRLPRGTTI